MHLINCGKFKQYLFREQLILLSATSLVRHVYLSLVWTLVSISSKLFLQLFFSASRFNRFFWELSTDIFCDGTNWTGKGLLNNLHTPSKTCQQISIPLMNCNWVRSWQLLLPVMVLKINVFLNCLFVTRSLEKGNMSSLNLSLRIYPVSSVFRYSTRHQNPILLEGAYIFFLKVGTL